MNIKKLETAKFSALALATGAIVGGAVSIGLDLIHGLPQLLNWGLTTFAFFGGAVAVLAQVDVKNKRSPKISASMGGMRWTRDEFCTGWLITGVTGYGKSQFLDYLLHQLFRNEKNFGGVFIDEKGLYDTVLIPIASHYGRKRDLRVFETRPMGSPAEWTPKETLNVFSDERVPENTYAEVIAQVAADQSGGKEDKGFFRTQATAHMGKAIALLRAIRHCQEEAEVPRGEWVQPAPDVICHILNNKMKWDQLLTKVGILVEAEEVDANGKGTGKMEQYHSYEKLDSPALRELLDHFRGAFWGVEGKEQLAGVQGTIYNYLSYFTNREVAEVFCRENTVTFDAIDDGCLFLIAMPQKFQVERRVVSALFKQLWYTHVLKRFDLRRLNPGLVLNLSVLFQDEGQRFVSRIDQNVEIIRGAEATTVICTQSQASIAEALGGKDKASPTTLNLRNRFIMRAADQWCAEENARFVGQHAIRRTTSSESRQGVSRSYSYETRYWVEPHSIRQFRKFHGLLCHSSGAWKSICFRPVTADGKVPAWWDRFEPLKMKVLRWFGFSPDFVTAGIPNKTPSRA